MVSLEQRHEMPAYPEEVEATLQEGIKVTNGWGPREILGNGSVTGIEFKKCTRAFDENGRFSPTYNEKASGPRFRPTKSSRPLGRPADEEFTKHVGLSRAWYFPADSVTLQTSLPGVFAGGDAMSGPKSVIEAVAAGKCAAESIDRFLNGRDLTAARFDKYA